MSLINRIYYKVRGTRVMRRIPSLVYAAGSPQDEVVKEEFMQPNLIVMSRFTEREIMREDIHNGTGILDVGDKTTPRRIFGIRIA